MTTWIDVSSEEVDWSRYSMVLHGGGPMNGRGILSVKDSIVTVRPTPPLVWRWSWPFRAYNPVAGYIAWHRVSLGLPVWRSIAEGIEMWWAYCPLRKGWRETKLLARVREWRCHG